MAWHLKDKELEQKLIGIDTDFSERLNQLCEKWDSNKDGDLYEYMQFSVPFFHGDRLHGEVIFSGDEVEKINEYNPNDWNEYPKVIPPTQRFMRLEVINSDYGREAIYIYKAQFENGLWVYGDYIVKIKDRDRVRFRPWELK